MNPTLELTHPTQLTATRGYNASSNPLIRATILEFVEGVVNVSRYKPYVSAGNLTNDQTIPAIDIEKTIPNWNGTTPSTDTSIPSYQCSQTLEIINDTTVRQERGDISPGTPNIFCAYEIVEFN